MRILLAIAVALVPVAASAQVYVQGHINSDGTYVQGHYRSAPNETRADNWSTQGNVNPYTGQEGTQNPYPTYNPPRTYSPPVYQPPSMYQQQRRASCTYSVYC